MKGGGIEALSGTLGEELSEVGQLDALLVLPKGAVLLSGNDPQNEEPNFGLVEFLGAPAELHDFVVVQGLVEDLKLVK